MAALALLGVLAAFAAWIATGPARAARRRRSVREQPFPPEWRRVLARRVPYLRQLPQGLHTQLEGHVRVFLSEKRFVGCDGLTVTDEMRVTIAAQACLLLLNRGTDYFRDLREILVYPDTFVVHTDEMDGAGVRHVHREARAGESWSAGQVILSWRDTLDGAAVPDDGWNVVIHEFAHQLDSEDGASNGAPLLRRAAYARWAEVFAAEFDRLRHDVARATPRVLDAYGATSPAEFFAVASECFFERAAALAAESPALYAELSAYYCVDPRAWSVGDH
jgi:Mlc titration factor MtfA (ptsG expression regulator)